MERNPVLASSGLSRRAALGSAGVLAATLGLGSRLDRVAAQGETIDLASHPLTGTWSTTTNALLMESPQIHHVSLFGADGTVLLMTPLSDIGPEGPVLTSAMVGVWEPYDERRGHFTATQMLSGLDGTFFGTVTVDGHPLVSEDGQTFSDDGVLVTVTIRDAGGAILEVVPPGTPSPRPVTGIRMAVGAPGFPEATPEAGTPTG